MQGRVTSASYKLPQVSRQLLLNFNYLIYRVFCYNEYHFLQTQHSCYLP